VTLRPQPRQHLEQPGGRALRVRHGLQRAEDGVDPDDGLSLRMARALTREPAPADGAPAPPEMCRFVGLRAAGAHYSQLAVCDDVPALVAWGIDEYDGLERVSW
jgi:hypothetical protein